MLELFVDASAPPGGDGSRSRPFRTLGETPLHGRLRLASGVYPGGLVLEDVELVGGPAVVLAASPPGPCLRTRGAVRLEGVQIQGGGTGLRAESGRASLEGVRFSGQRGAGIEVAAGAELVLARSSLQASVSGLPGVRILPGGRAELSEVRIQGPYQRAVDAERPASLLLSAVHIQDAVSGLWLSGGEAWLDALDVRGGRGPGLYVAGATLHLREVTVTGHEYGLLTGAGARVDGAGLRSTGAERAGLGLVRAHVVLEDVRVESAGTMAGVQIVGSEVELRGLDVQGGRSTGVVARDARLTVDRATISGPRSADADEGDAFQVRGGRAAVSGLSIQGCSGIGFLAAEGATVTLVRSSIRGAGVAGVSVETLARLTGRELLIEGTQGPAVLVTERGRARLGAITARSNRDGAVWAECAQAVVVEIDGWSGDATPAPAACIRSSSPLSPRR